MRLSAALRSPDWLSSLKAAQLQRIARATGIQSSGTKGLLVERIAAQLGLQSDSDKVVNPTGSIPSNVSQGQDLHRLGGSNNQSQGATKNKSLLRPIPDPKPWSILSIDMGIQNLAFAHLHLPRSNGENTQLPVLTAWHRLAVSEIASLNLTGVEDAVQAQSSALKSTDEPDEPDNPAKRSAKSSSTSKSKSKEVESFSPDLYAATAYKLIKSLLTAYQPTHILIERQRFRSGNGSAVQEWTLRVGVFEGMLYAILHALRMERGESITVQGVEPKRVVGYWLEPSAAKEAERLNAREVKKAKIDIVGRWISATQLSKTNSELTSQQPELAVESFEDKILLADPSNSPALGGIVNEYMRKWKKEPKPKKSRASKGTPTHDSPSAEVAIDIGKLDDLADCLLQGVTWIEWQEMRERIVRDGPKALDKI
ncbi:unnamed protein product [Penicillium salamii]|uniref:SAP domain-containing protein n=1 Tax=Penicillium salamii TaxID=1612424 RepID=A0A9W4NLC7_9EURO|nr:unnamed protein product [Penicillium salamii]CAG8103335.1 unnamed protein product [Penicillium salamii]CAG8376433.1 unnamed protein product [Penicillium salamii]CAG8378083.1 unnamed protein product [Penicillium salamii]CAG8379758.1 unnamed protein product [Penicillium salamii]